ncbi:hypothetical protein ACA910_014129 [Epithemia clementina (nom. ined.)]
MTNSNKAFKRAELAVQPTDSMTTTNDAFQDEEHGSGGDDIGQDDKHHHGDDEEDLFSESRGANESSSGESSSHEGNMLAQKETRIVHCLRLGVLFFLFLSAGGIAYAVYHYTSDIDQNEFDQAVLNYATKAIEALEVNTERQLMALDNFASQMTAHAISTNSTWPMVTVPAFSVWVRSTLSEIKGLSLITCPVVMEKDRAEWNKYVSENGPPWFQAEMDFQAAGGYDLNLRNPSTAGAGATGARNLQDDEDTPQRNWTTNNGEELDISTGFASDIVDRADLPNGTRIHFPDHSGEPYTPLWQNAPSFPIFVHNRNYMLAGDYEGPFRNCIANHTAVTGGSFNTAGGIGVGNSITDNLLAVWGRQGEAIGSDPLGSYFYPVHEDLYDKNSKVVALIIMYVHWRQLFVNLLPPDAKGLVTVMENTCGQVFSFEINGADVRYLGEEDLHDPHYDHLMQSTKLTSYFNEHRSKLYYGVPLSPDKGCQYTLRVYPSRTLEETYESNFPVIATVVVVLIFVFAILVFISYDCFVERRQRLVMRNALRTGAIVSSMFPSGFKDRLIEEESLKGDQPKKGKKAYLSNKGHIKSFLDHGDSGGSGIHQAKPLADLFPATTVMFADISNFTSWASQRDPEQVFMLLQSIYQAFDALAKKRKVWKVETVGDSYVAVTGIPDAQPDHAVIMACFAEACLQKFIQVTRMLETTLGPDTGELKMRFGLHSGPCTAGVLRGERSRFQLFGDTVNVASRMESSGMPNRIQVSKATADLLEAAGKGHWLMQRSDEINIKGKGYVQTFFVAVKGTKSIASHTPSTSDASFFNDSTRRNDDLTNHTSSKKTLRLVEWNVKTLGDRLRAVLARRIAVKGKRMSVSPGPAFVRQADTCLDEMKDVISMPAFDPRIAAKESDPDQVDLGEEVISQLRLYVSTIASLYHDENPFHNFSHASHVAMSVDKLLKRIIAPDIVVDEKSASSNATSHGAYVGLQLHDYTHGITSDPLTQFAIVFSALIHDVDHHGVSNIQLSKENPTLARVYRNKSIAEQNSIDVAWNVLMRQDDFQALRNCIYTDKNELTRFRQTVINVVLATDIFDKELNELRKQRWNNAFSEKCVMPEFKQEDTNVKATIVIEHLIQASDVAHTMQHWHVYRKWNERLFVELLQAYRSDRMDQDPSTFWYKGEIGFFDHYIIPLAKKLKDCNVFGVFSDEYLSYAKANREEWEQKGQAIVAELVEKYKGGAHVKFVEDHEEEEEEGKNSSHNTTAKSGRGSKALASNKSLIIQEDEVFEEEMEDISTATTEQEHLELDQPPPTKATEDRKAAAFTSSSLAHV